MSPNLQVKLLRVLQDRTFEPVGSSKTVKVNVRVVAATHQNLEEAIQERRFREDLFYRLNVIPIEAPALRERGEDVALLVQHFLDVANQEKGKRIDGIHPQALEALCAYRWPGNVRELENLMERMVILKGEGEIGMDDLPDPIRAGGAAQAPGVPRIPADGLAFNDVVGRFESDLILQALEQTHWNKNQAARLLGLNRTTLLEKIKKRGLTSPPEA
jgi:DNA-binding NtrC family response regulator